MKWSTPKYPGDAVRSYLMKRNGETGSIVIQHFGRTVLVAAFLPGQTIQLPGDTPKRMPELSDYFDPSSGLGRVLADAEFDSYVEQAVRDGWLVTCNPPKPKPAADQCAREALVIAAKIKPLMADTDTDTRSAVLAELTARWLADSGHSESDRLCLLEIWMLAVVGIADLYSLRKKAVDQMTASERDEVAAHRLAEIAEAAVDKYGETFFDEGVGVNIKAEVK